MLVSVYIFWGYKDPIRYIPEPLPVEALRAQKKHTSGKEVDTGPAWGHFDCGAEGLGLSLPRLDDTDKDPMKSWCPG